MAHDPIQKPEVVKKLTQLSHPPTKLSNSPPVWLNEVMKVGATTDFFVLAVLIAYHIKQYIIPENDSLWPVRQAYALHGSLVIVNGLASTWKGWSIDRNAFYALHHAITHIFFYYTTSTPSNGSSKYLAAMIIYLFMRIFKRIKDEGSYTDEQWKIFYVLYTYAQTITSLFFTLWMGHEYKPIDIIGCIALIDSTYTCRKVDISTKLFEGIPILITEDVLQKHWMRKTLSVLDVVVVWTVAAIPLHLNSNGGSSMSALLNIDSYRALIAFAFVDLVVKRLPMFKRFERPRVYEYTKSSSFPSAHAAVAVVSCQSLPPLAKVLLTTTVGMSRISTRSHTPEDVCAGFIVGDMFNIAWITAAMLIGKIK